MKTVFLLAVVCGLTTAVIRDHIYVNILKNWMDAQKYCRQHYRDLSTIQSYQEQMMLTELSGFGWIGLYRDMNSPENFLWSDGDPFSFSNWLYDESMSTYSSWSYFNVTQNCVASFGKWFERSCGSPLNFYCYKSIILIREKMTWEDALEYCRIHHTDLASWTSNSLRFNREMMESQTDSVWAGLRFQAGEWFWVNGKPLGNQVFTLPACPAQPSRCGAFNTQTGKWENRDCGEKLNFMCN